MATFDPHRAHALPAPKPAGVPAGTLRTFSGFPYPVSWPQRLRRGQIAPARRYPRADENASGFSLQRAASLSSVQPTTPDPA